jgi:hypothetical protein
MWQTIKKAKGYKEWQNANVSCFLLGFQMQLVVKHISAITNEIVTIHKAQEDDLDFLYLTMTNLCNNMLKNNTLNNVNYNNLLEQQEILYKQLNRVLYFVQ